jgi:hypothetical protein
MLGTSLQHYIMVSKVKNDVLGSGEKHAVKCERTVQGGPEGDVFLK